jgi:transposase-like protein
MNKEPKTLQEAIVYFSNKENCRDYLVARRWPNGVTCPRCGSENVTEQPKYNRWQCSSHHANIEDKSRQFTLKTGTIFEDSPIGLDKWLMVMWMVVNCKNGISSYEIHRAIGVTQKSAWFMSHRVRLALGMEPSKKLSGHVEIDETFIGGKARFMHASKRFKVGDTGYVGKVAVMGLLERHGEVRCQVVPNTRRKSLEPIINGFLLRLAFGVYRLFEQLVTSLAEQSGPIRAQLDESRIFKNPAVAELVSYNAFLSQFNESAELQQ